MIVCIDIFPDFMGISAMTPDDEIAGKIVSSHFDSLIFQNHNLEETVFLIDEVIITGINTGPTVF